MRFSLDVLRARKGDCLMVHFGSKAQPGLVMIDGGPRAVYSPYLKCRLKQIIKARELADNERWMRAVLTDFRIPFDDHKTGRRMAFTQWMFERQSSNDPSSATGAGRKGYPCDCEPERDNETKGGRIEHFKFNLEDKVLIREVQRPGTVEALTIDFLGPQYRVVYWDNSERKTAWLKADELDPR